MYKNIKVCDVEYRVYNNGVIIRNDNDRVLKASKTKDGYLFVNLGHSKNRTRKYVHRLVAELFIASDIDINKLTVNHKDYNKENNHYSNLEWVTREYNSSNSYNQLNHSNVGSSNKNAKLNEDDVVKIKTLIKEGKMRVKDIADLFNVKYTTISDIKNNRTWKRVQI